MADQSKQEKQKSLPPFINFLNAGLSGICATCVVHPTDVVKNRMQISTETVSIKKTFLHILRNERIINFYDGLSASLVRQATYTTTRLGVYNQLQDSWRERYTGKPNFLTLCAMAAIAGGSGAFIGTPADLALVRMTTDGRLPPDQRRNYRNVADAFIRVAKEEGVMNLWRGSVATMGRAVVVNVSQLATYSQTKVLINSKMNVPEGFLLHIYSAMISGLVTSFNSMPFDIAKTRIQNLKDVKKPPTIIKVMLNIAKTEGIMALWKGFVPTYCRIGPHTIITFVCNEQFAKFYKTYVSK
ncbi:mitochondrial 2-oxoglutarate/malate carrier protein-like [Leptopilina heterotoma]|uniref:mitochondrial 2-oxoglutarate/malate carrier protein-like n=1 Tax=Leptopilina heterotoma TaxID=63436 RepID=UPI001CA9BF60|nr:mitochondrial 2-oxoglutarate/malate carrier protein-like [Leptopilina heterotoma]